MKTNEGEVPQYYVEESHEAIIPPDEWDKVQKEFVRRKAMGRSYSGNSIFATKVICEDCGSFFGSKVWNSTSEKYRRTIWQCNNKFKGEQKCSTPHITEETLREAFIEAFNILFCNMDEVIQNCEMIAEQLTDCTSIDEQIYELKQELDVITEMIQKCVQENATTPLSQEEYLKRYQSFVDKYKSKNEELTKLEQDKILKISRGESFKEFIDAFVKVDGYIEEFDDSLWLTTVEKVIVKKNQDLTFRFFNGTEIEVSSKKCNKPKCS